MSDRIRIGIVGWGEVARIYTSLFAANGAVLSAVVSRQRCIDENVPIFQTLEEMLPYVDAVIVAVPPHLHAKLCLQAVQAKKPVLVEKPLCITEQEINEIEHSFRHLTSPVHLGLRLRWNPTLIELKGRISGLTRIECIYHMGIHNFAEDKDWPRSLPLSGGSFFTLGIHALDLVRWFANAEGQPLSQINASATQWSQFAEYPLNVWVSGTLSDGVEVLAGTDQSGSSAQKLELRIDAEVGSFPDGALSLSTFEDENVEFEGLFANFVRAVETNKVDKDYTEEILQSHRELLMARNIARSA